MINKLLSLGFIATMIALTSACGQNEESDPLASVASAEYNESASCELAESEPEMLWYASEVEDSVRSLVAGFEAHYPDIGVKFQRLSSGELTVRYTNEYESGVDSASLITVADSIWIKDGVEKGWFEKLSSDAMPELETFPSEYMLDDYGLLAGTTVWNIVYNTNLITEEPENSWEFLIDPANKDNIFLTDPRNLPSFMALISLWQEEYGDEFLEKLKDQNITWVDSSVPGTQQVAAGQKGMLVPGGNSYIRPLQDEEAPIDSVTPDLTVGNESYGVVTVAGKSPNAAMCLLNYIASEEGQILLNEEAGRYSPLGAVGNLDALPENYQSPDLESLPEVSDEIVELLGIGGR